jgi:uncharacterized protein YjbI with pentapeptide repeats
MFKLFCLTAILSTALLSFNFEFASCNPVPEESQYLTAPQADTMSLVCYIQREDGRVLDLGNLCGVSAQETRNATIKATEVNRLLTTNECAGCDLRGANLARVNLDFANLTGANLTGANLTGTNLTGANLSNVNLANADLSGAKLNGARMMGANLNGASLANANLLGANLIKANLNGTRLNATKMPDGKIHN